MSLIDLRLTALFAWVQVIWQTNRLIAALLEQC